MKRKTEALHMLMKSSIAHSHRYYGSVRQTSDEKNEQQTERDIAKHTCS